MGKGSFSRKNDEQILQAVATIINRDISDPRLELVTVTGVRTSPDRSVATVYVSADKNRYDEVLAGLESAKGRIRSILGSAIDWRTTPELRFFIDEAIDKGDEIQELLRNVPPSLQDQE